MEGDRVGVSAVEETNTLLVRSTPQAWRSIREVIEKLDVMPLQVHIEAQVAEVALTGDLKYGVNWFFDNAVAGRALTGALAGLTLPPAAGGSWNTFAGGVTGNDGVGWAFTGHNAAAVVSALDKVTDLRLLQTPSVFVRNNAEATLNVGDKVPINTTTVNTGVGTSTYSSVQYIDTGVILKVRPRVTRDGTVFRISCRRSAAPPTCRTPATRTSATAIRASRPRSCPPKRRYRAATPSCWRA